MNLVQLAGALPRDPQFREWIAMFWRCEVSEEDAVGFIRDVCLVASRRDLATNAEAARRFHEHIRRPFVEYCEKQEMTV